MDVDKSQINLFNIVARIRFFYMKGTPPQKKNVKKKKSPASLEYIKYLPSRFDDFL